MNNLTDFIGRIGNLLEEALIDVADSERGKITENFNRLLTSQVLKNADLPSSIKEQVSKKFERAFIGALGGSQSSFEDLIDLSERYGLSSNLKKFDNWSQSSGRSFIVNDLKNSTTVSKKQTRSAPFLKINTGEQRPNFLNYLEKDIPDFFSLTGTGGVSTDFLVNGKHQTSRSYQVKLNTGFADAHEITFYEPSKGGFISGNTPRSGGGVARSNAVYTTPSDFITGYNNGKFSAKNLNFYQLQIYHMKGLKAEIDKINLSESLTRAEKQGRISEAVGYYQRTIDRLKTYVGDYKQLADKNRIRSNQRAKTMLTQASTMYVAGFENGPQPGDLNFFEAIEQEGIKLNLSSGQAGKVVEGYNGMTVSPKGLRQNVSHYSGLDVPNYKEPHKALGELGLIKRGPQAISFTGQGGELSRFSKLLPDLERKINDSLRGRNIEPAFDYNPEGVRMVVAFGGNIDADTENIVKMTKEEYEELVRRVGKTEADQIKASREMLSSRQLNLARPEGSLVVNKNLFKDGAMDVVQNRSYNISYGSVIGDDIASKRLQSIVSGGMIDLDLGQFDASLAGQRGNVKISGGIQEKPFQILDFDESTRKLLGDKSQGLIGKRAKIDFSQNEFLGFDDLNNLTRTMGQENVSEVLDSLKVNPQSGNIELNTFAVTSTINDGSDVIPHISKISGGHQTDQIKATLDPVREEMFAEYVNEKTNIRYDARKIDAYESVSKLQKASTRAYYQTGALQVGIAEALEKGMLREQHQKVLREKLVMSASPEALLQTLMDDDFVRMLGYRGDLGRQTFTERLATVSGILAKESSNPEEVLKMTLGNAMSPYNEWGASSGLLGSLEEGVEYVGKKPGTMSTRSYASPEMTGQETLESKAWRIRKTKLGELNKGLSVAGFKGSGPNQAAELLYGKNSMVSNFVAGIRDEGNLLGMGQRASVEPRFFDISAANPNLHPAMRDISGRMTNFMPVIKGLTQSLSGEFSPMHDVFSLNAQGKEVNQLLGKKSFNLDLGISDELLQEINYDNPNKVSNRLFVPGGEDFASMQRMSMGSGLEQSRSMRSAYETYIQDIQEAKREGSAGKIKTATSKFRGSLQTLMKTNLFGVSGSEIGGLLRGDVQGSIVAYNRGVGLELMNQLGLKGSAPSLRGAQARQREVFHSLIQGTHGAFDGTKVDVGRITFMSKAAAKQAYNDLANSYEQRGMAQAARNVRAKHAELLAGGIDTVSVMRNPGIGPESHSAGIVMLDLADSASGSSFYVKSGQSFLDITDASIKVNGVAESEVAKVQKSLQRRVQVSLQQGVNSDLDGDRLNIFPLGSDEAVGALNNQIRQREYNHGLRYGVFKGLATESLKGKSSGFRQLYNQYGIGVSREAGESIAHAGPKQFVPFLSNPLTHLKFAVAHSGVDSSSKLDLLAIAETLEQVPIGSKHVAAQADVAKAYQQTISGIGKSIWSDNATRESISEDVENLFRLGFGIGENQAIPDQITIKTSQGEELINNLKLRNDLVDSIMETRQNKARMAVVQTLRNKKIIEFGRGPEFETNFLDFLKNEVSQVHGGIDAKEVERLGGSLQKAYGARASRAAIQEINENIIQGTKKNFLKNASKLTQGHMKALGVGAAVVGGSAVGIGMVMSSTFSDRSRDTQIDPDMLFPEEVSAANTNLHNPISGLGAVEARISPQNYQINVMSQGELSPATGISRFAAGAANLGINNLQMAFNDNRVNMDPWTLAKYKRDFY